MTHQATDSADQTGLRARLDRFFASVGMGFNAYMESRSRMHQITRLNALSDRELNAMGLKREDIPRHVFRDLLYS
ncbi:DUF1127 domain-containing protein [Oceanicola sp. D3]|uniref:DUF1127 domain-containing protein n=1 Tax=Oceanicola sp. D3 TaxID=2587163 RepID=UPI00111F6136|nr:DUF1127 domain-containing protein [Oceanicola sp. D3]QDC08852.1 DUF1127 domain-containing protein [Oceanicola sp. D3]